MTEIRNRKSLYGFEMTADRPDLRRNETGRKTHDIQQLWQRTHEILRLALLGMNYKDIADMLGVHRQTVSNTLNSDLGMRKLSALRLRRDQDTIDVAEEIAKLFPKALKTYEEILANEKSSLSLKKEVADTILMDIGGHRAPAKIEGKMAHAHLVRAEIEAIKERGVAAAKAAGMLIEGETS